MKLRSFFAICVGVGIMLAVAWLRSADQTSDDMSDDGPIARSTREALALLMPSQNAGTSRTATSDDPSSGSRSIAGTNDQRTDGAPASTEPATSIEPQTAAPQSSVDAASSPDAAASPVGSVDLSQPTANDASPAVAGDASSTAADNAASAGETRVITPSSENVPPPIVGGGTRSPQDVATGGSPDAAVPIVASNANIDLPGPVLGPKPESPTAVGQRTLSVPDLLRVVKDVACACLDALLQHRGVDEPEVSPAPSQSVAALATKDNATVDQLARELAGREAPATTNLVQPAEPSVASGPPSQGDLTLSPASRVADNVGGTPNNQVQPAEPSVASSPPSQGDPALSPANGAADHLADNNNAIRPIEPARSAAPAGTSVPETSSLPSADGATKETRETLSPELLALRDKVRRVLDLYRNRRLNTRDYSAWEIMHSFIAYGVSQEVEVGAPGGPRANAIGWLCFNGPAAGDRLFYAGTDGPSGRVGPGLQGHRGQFLAMLAQCKVPITYPMKVEGHDYTVADLVREEQRTCQPKTELTFKLIGLMHYLKSDAQWQDENGGSWNLPRLVREELAQPIIGATCGGTHRLFGLTYAYKKRIQRGEPVDGQYARARIFIHDYQQYTFKLQNPDGSFSTAFFAGRGAVDDLQRRLETTGHIAEWMAFSLDDQQRRDPRMIKAINYLSDLLLDNPRLPWKVGPLGHALHALNMYDQYALEPQAQQSPTATVARLPRNESVGAADETAGPADDDPAPAPPVR